MDLDIIARTTAILLAGAAVASLLRRAAPSTRHFVWHISIVVVLLAPVAAPLVPNFALPAVPGVPAVRVVPTGVVLSAVASSLSHLETGPQRNNAVGTPGSLGTLGTISSIGSGAVLFWFSFCWLLSGISVWRGSKPAPEIWLSEARTIRERLGLKPPIRVRQSLKECSPHVAGLFESVVIMPPSASAWTAEARQAALVHELTHVKRHDRRTQAIAQLACAIYWFNPLTWYAAAGLARERERACDDEVLRFGARPSAYATLLLDLARTHSAWTPATALSMARPSAIEGRLLSILADAVRTPHRSTRWVVGVGIMTLTTAILGAQAAAPASPAPAPAPRPVATQSLMAMDHPVTDQSVTSALINALRDSDGQVREQAALGLAITPGADVVEPLITALKDPDAQVREKAAIGLAFRRDPRIVAPLLAAIEDGDGQVREKAAIALGASGDTRAIAALTRATTDPDSQVREKAIAGLVLLGLRK